MYTIGVAKRYAHKNELHRWQIGCVYDRNSFPAKDFNGVADRMDKLNMENSKLQYHAAWSNECIGF